MTYNPMDDDDIIVPASAEPVDMDNAEGDDADAPAKDNSRKIGVAVLGGILVILAMVIVFALAPKGTPADGVLPADPANYHAPALTLPRLDGAGNLTLADLKGKPVVLNFWASWCVTCKAEAQLMADTEKKWRDKGVVFIGVDSSDTNDSAKAWEKTYGVEYPSIVDSDGKTKDAWRVTGFPETFFIGADGIIKSKFISAIDEKSLNDNLNLITGG